jgi:hypothetical protein
MMSRAAIPLAALVAAAGITGCGHAALFASPAAAHKPQACMISAMPSAVVVLIHRDSPSSRAELNAILLTAIPNEHFLLFKAATGKLVSSFTTPRGPVLPGPTPPSPLPSDPTQVQLHAYSHAADTYSRTLQHDRARLHLRWLARLATWAHRIMTKATAPPWDRQGPDLASELPGLMRGLTSAGASITSLNTIPGTHLGPRIVVAILGLEKVPVAAPPPLPIGLREATIVIAGFTGNSNQEDTWRANLASDGARAAVLLTPSTNDELPAVVAPVISQAIPHPAAC